MIVHAESEVVRNHNESGMFENMTVLSQEIPVEGSQYKFNCISWSLGITDEWLWPEMPVGRNKGDLMRWMTNMNAQHGYRPGPFNLDVEPGVDKIVMYIKDGFATHQARQEKDGTWTSKLGQMELITHPDVQEVEGECYGVASRIFRRESCLSQ